ncbi:MAG: NADH-quinone oxidoreductase subunit [Thermoplasmata archaeon]|jgi:NADH-quinone oxidoreductase subunit K|nr:NADH-quinone oxidoreductase subunit [Thermoplasmata archaeon]
MIPVAWSLTLSAALLCVGVFGLLIQRSALRVLVAVELVLNAANINFVAFANANGKADGLVFALFSIALAAAEAAVGLAILLHFYRHGRSVDVNKSTILRW